MERVGEHPVPVGPLAVRWLAYELDELAQGSRRRRGRLENAGSAPWRSRGRRGRPALVPLARPARERDRVGWAADRISACRRARRDRRARGRRRRAAAAGELSTRVRPRRGVPLLVPGDRIGSLDLPVVVEPRIAERRLGVQLHGEPDAETKAALAAQEEPLVAEDAVAIAHLVPWALPAQDWSRLCSTRTRRATRAVGAAVEAGVTRRSAAARPLELGRRAKPALRPPAAPSVAAGRDSSPGPTKGCPPTREGRALRRSRGRQTSVAIRSSERLKT